MTPSVLLKEMPATESFLKTLKKHPQWSHAEMICGRLAKAGFDAVLAGGCVRDGFLGVSPKDFDIATDATPDEVELLFEKTVSVGKNFGVIVVPLDDGGTIEIATFRKDGNYSDGRRPESVQFSDRAEDAKRRDFTVNALFFDPIRNVIFDYVGGLADLAAGILRVVGDPEKRFQEDRLRLLRAVRFSGQLGFEISPETEAAVKRSAKNLKDVSRERIRDEVDKLLMTKWAKEGFSNLDRMGLSEPVFSDWASMIFPTHERVFSEAASTDDLDVKRLLFLFPALKNVSPARAQERLKQWKYGRSFTELTIWLLKNESSLRSSSEDPSPNFASRALLLQKFKLTPKDSSENLEAKLFSEEERRWMTSLELWTDPRAVRACRVLDLVLGIDKRREVALQRRGIVLGQPDSWQAKSQDLLIRADAKDLEGPNLGRELRRLNREILLRQ